MKIIPKPFGGPRPQKNAGGIALGFVLIMALAAYAHAEGRHDDGRREAGDRDWREHAGRVHGYEPGVVYAPPVVYTAPQYEEPAFNLVVPLNIR